MAKAKKETTSKKDQTAPAPAAAKPKKAKAENKTAAAKPAAAPMIDTGLAAATAARWVMHQKDEPAASSSAASARGESASFKQMKENLHKPAGQTSPGFLSNAIPTKKFNPSVPGRQQVGRNQTFGADVNRSGVPRRTGG